MLPALSRMTWTTIALAHVGPSLKASMRIFGEGPRVQTDETETLQRAAEAGAGAALLDVGTAKAEMATNVPAIAEIKPNEYFTDTRFAPKKSAT